MRTISLSLLAVAVLAGTATGADRTFERRVAADPQGKVSITNVAGNVEVTGWDRAEVYVVAELDEDVDRVDVTSGDGRTVIKVVPPRGSGRSGEATLTVHIPHGSELEVTSVSADIVSRKVFGEQRLRSVSGNIDADGVRSNVEIKTVSGDAKLVGLGQAARSRLTTVSGEARLDRVAGELEITSTSGDIVVRSGVVEVVRVRTTSGDVDFQGTLAEGARLEAESVSGDLSVRAPAASGYEYEIATFSGDIDSCFDARPEPTSRYGPGSRLFGKRGDGRAHVRIKTMSGDVEICDR